MRLLIFLLIISWSAQAQDSATHKHSKAKAIAKVFVAPVALIGVGLYTMDDGSLMNRFAVRDWRNEHAPNFKTHVDDVMQFVPIGLVYGLDLVNVNAKNDLINRTLLLAKSEILVNAMIRGLKATTNVTRPDGSNNHSFPSGHTAQAFMAATFMHKELGHRSVWFSIGAYSMASSVGVMRVLQNRHWISDVLAGAGIGILSTNIVYATHRYRWGKRPNLTVLPTYSDGPGIYVALKIGNN
jgi:membrane-associated phospholipid phosphatase